MKQTNRIAKFNLAREKFNNEIDLYSILTLQRISHFLAKINTSKRQRRSVEYFRKYTIGDTTVILDKNKKAKQKKDKKSMTRRQIEEKEL